jgi:arylsulfatase A-like enzyme
MSSKSRREFLGTLAAVSALPTASAAGPQRPNIVYILADDLGWGDLSCYNKDSGVPMPNANRLASEGMRFTDMHSGSAVCTPTRYGILTGRYCWRSRLKQGVLGGYSPNLIEKGRLTVPALLRQQGYYTAGVGKWHLGLGTQAKCDFTQPLDPNPTTHGFDYYYGIPASLDMAPYLYFENGTVVEQPTAHTEGKNDPRGVFWRPGPIAPSLKIEEVLPHLTAKAVSILKERARTPDKPFFLYFPLTGPHTPWVPTAEFRGKSKAGDYGDFAVQVDDVLGQILRTLEETGAAKNTLIIFTSDNGAHWTPEDREKFAHRANAAWKGQKADIWDAGHRIPFLARWPGQIKPGSVSNDIGCLTDLMATVAEITQASLPASAGEDSISLLPALSGKKGKRDTIVHHSLDGLFAIRQKEWKLAVARGSGGFSEPKRIEPKPGEATGELYDLKEDPSEQRNLWGSRQDVVKRLTALLSKYRAQGYSR